MSFSANLKNIRRNIGMTQKALGEGIGVTSVTIGNWERGVRQPSFELLPKLADALGTSVDDLLGLYKAASLNPTEEALLNKFRLLDAHGQKLVHIVCDAELERLNPRKSTELLRWQKPHGTPSDRKQGRYIPFYLTPPAAGIATPFDENGFEMLLADDAVPPEADYAVCVSGDSMEPYIRDGEMVFVKETQELSSGDVGIFCVDGAMYCKQYYAGEEGSLHLLSANPDRAYASIFIDEESGSSVKCCGKVLLLEPVPLPKYFKRDERRGVHAPHSLTK